MSKADDRRKAQQDELDAQIAMSHARPNEPGRRTADADACPARFGPHDYTMKGRDGIYRCWYCARRKPERPS